MQAGDVDWLGDRLREGIDADVLRMKHSGARCRTELERLRRTRDEFDSRYFKQTDKSNKPVGDWISAPSPNFVAMATRVGPTTFWMAALNRPSLSRPKRLRSICMPYKPTYRRFCAKFGGVNFGR